MTLQEQLAAANAKLADALRDEDVADLCFHEAEKALELASQRVRACEDEVIDIEELIRKAGKP